LKNTMGAFETGRNKIRVGQLSKSLDADALLIQAAEILNPPEADEGLIPRPLGR
jgi:hypothetical protein